MKLLSLRVRRKISRIKRPYGYAVNTVLEVSDKIDSSKQTKSSIKTSSSKRAFESTASSVAKGGLASIDDLFQTLKTAKKEKRLKIDAEATAAEIVIRADRAKSKALTAGEKFKHKSPEAPVHRIDAASGLPVYKAALLRAGDGGGTALCPFDCDCCF